MFPVPGHFMRDVTNAQLAIMRAMTDLTRRSRRSVALPRQPCRNSATLLQLEHGGRIVRLAMALPCR
jgi:hypothetical protein